MADPTLPQLYIPPDVLSRERLNYQRGFKLLTLPPTGELAASRSKLPPPPASTGERSPQRMGNARQAGHKPAFRFDRGQLVNEGLYPVAGTNFHTVATPWELRWSNLCNGGGTFVPVVKETDYLEVLGMGTVAAHRGSVGFERLVCYGTPTIDPKSGWLSGEGWVFVYDRETQSIPPGSTSRLGTPQKTYDVLTTVDGQVLAVLGVIDHQALRGANWVIDLVLAPLLAPAMIRLAYGAARMGSALIARAEARLARNALAGPTKDLVEQVVTQEAAAVTANLVKDVGLEAAMAARGLRLGGWERRMGVPQQHYQKMVETAKETQTVAVFRANKEVAIELIEKGAIGKAKGLSIPKFKSSDQTGVLTAVTPQQIQLVKDNGYYLLEVTAGKPPMMRLGNEVKPLPQKPYWKMEQNQVIHPSGHPVVGDYDGLGALPLKSPGRNIAPVPENPTSLKSDWLGPDWEKYMNSINLKLDRHRVLHGAQDQLPLAGGGLDDGLAYAVFPDGRAVMLKGRAEQQAFYDAFGRQTAHGQYGAGARVPPPKTDTPDLRVVK